MTEENKGLRERLEMAVYNSGELPLTNGQLDLIDEALAADRREGEQAAPGLREAVQGFVNHADDTCAGVSLPQMVGGCVVCARLFENLRAALTALPSPPREEGK